MVFGISVTIVAAIVLWGVASPATLGHGAAWLLAELAAKIGWFYLVAVFGFVLFSLYLAFSRLGAIRLGQDDDEPEYSTASWFAMLFSAGMGIGLVFWGVAEPLSHYLSPPEGAPGGTAEAARLAMRYTFFHWGLHAWAIYSVVGLAIAYFSFRRGEPALISRTCRPLLGARVEGWIGRAIDIFAVLATAFGVATSLGLGAIQINGGLAALTGISVGHAAQLWIIALTTVAFVASSLSGLDRGILFLSNLNMALALLLLAAVLLLGPTAFLFGVLTSTLGSYLGNLVTMSLRLTPFSDATWVRDWTLFYWAWWIAWSPFVGLFIARISRGRTIREFVLGVLLVPALFSFLWFAVFGGYGLQLEMFGGLPIAAAVKADVSSALFTVLAQLPLGTLLSIVATALIMSFFVTSADSATFVLGMLSSRGEPNPPAKVKLVWGALIAGIAAVLLLAGGLKGLQSASIAAAGPFAVIMIVMCVSLWRSLRAEDRERRRDERRMLRALHALVDRDESARRD